MPPLDQRERYWPYMNWITLVGRLKQPLQHATRGRVQ